MTRYDDTAATVTSAFAETAGIDEVDSETGFFDLGADSVAIVRFAARLREHWPALRTVDVFSHPTVAELSGYLVALSGRTAAGSSAGSAAQEHRTGRRAGGL